jgi:hypothetical protein
MARFRGDIRGIERVRRREASRSLGGEKWIGILQPQALARLTQAARQMARSAGILARIASDRQE